MTNVKRRVGIFLVWTVFVGIAAIAFRYWYVPKAEEKKHEVQTQAAKDLVNATSSSQRFDKYVDVYADGFAGYGIIRSAEFRNRLASFGVGLNIKDDGADYETRIKALESGDADIAAFPIDSFFSNCKKLDPNRLIKTPATFISLIDETVGGDAAVGYGKKYPNGIDSLNNPNTKFVCVRNSPSEFIVRVMRANFDLTQVPEDAFIDCKSAEEVFEHWRASKPDDNKVYITWEPYITKMLENPNMTKFVDTSRFRGYVADAFCSNRDFLVKNPETVRIFLECYFGALHENHDKIMELVKKDAVAAGLPISDKQAGKIVEGIWWKNVQENYAHMGLVKGHSMMHIEDIIHQITLVLKKTDPSYVDPTDGVYRNVYSQEPLMELRNRNFHPGQTIGSDGELRQEIKLKELSEPEWQKLQPVGTLQVPAIDFARGTSNLTSGSEDVLNELIKNLQTWRSYYLLVEGSASTLGNNLEANKGKARERTKVVVDYLVRNGIDPVRIRAAQEVKLNGTSVSFKLGQLPY